MGVYIGSQKDQKDKDIKVHERAAMESERIESDRAKALEEADRAKALEEADRAKALEEEAARSRMPRGLFSYF